MKQVNVESDKNLVFAHKYLINCFRNNRLLIPLKIFKFTQRLLRR